MSVCMSAFNYLLHTLSSSSVLFPLSSSARCILYCWLLVVVVAVSAAKVVKVFLLLLLVVTQLRNCEIFSYGVIIIGERI